MTDPLAPTLPEALVPGVTWHLPALALPQAEIIRFAREVDPQPIHIDETAARKGPFGRIIASGLHPYIALHKAYWVRLNSLHFFCGLSFDKARFYAPVYPDSPFYGKLFIETTEPRPHKNRIIVSWGLDVYNAADDVLLQENRFTTYHLFELPNG
jgi:acyl dehydratase